MAGIGLKALKLGLLASTLTTPASLFQLGEAGVWYDPSDLTTLFQDSAGTTPVTAAGQSVGLVLDKRLGLVPGIELLGNGATALVGTATAASYNTSTGAGSVTRVDLSNQSYVQWTGLNNTSIYKITITNTGNPSIVIRVGGPSTLAYVTIATGVTVTAHVFPSSGVITITTASLTGSFVVSSFRELPGNHAIQSTSLSRPTLGRNPITGTRNLLTYSEFPNGVTDATNRGGLLTDTTFSGLSSNTGLAFGYDGATLTYAYKNGGVNGIQYTFSVYVRMDDGDAPVFGGASAPAATNDFAIVIGGQTSAPNSFIVQNLGGGLYRVSGNAVAGTTGKSGVIKYNSNSNRTFKVSGYQLETGSTVTAYQKVVSAFDVTEQGKADCWYLSFDGSDDFLVTPTITPGTDKAQLFAGVRKLSDAAAGCILESSTSYVANAGAVAMFAPISAASNEYAFAASGATTYTGYRASTYAAPITSVLTGLFDLAGVSRATNVIPRVNGQTPGTLTNLGSSAIGGGNLLAYPAYIGRRAGTSLPFNGHIYSLIGRFGANLTSDQIAQTEVWVNGKTGAY